MIRRARFLVVAVLFLLAPMQRAGATPTGENGSIAFGEAKEIYSIAPDGSGLADLSRMKRWGFCGSDPIDSVERQPEWSPDGTALVFLQSPSPAQCGLTVLPDSIDIFFPGFGHEPLVKGNVADPTWSPDGSRIAFVNGSHIWVMRPTGRGKTDLGVSGWDPAWSPDGSTILYTCDCTAVGNLRTIPATGGSPIDITTGANGGHDWSPDGATIVYGTGSDIFSMPAGGGGPTNLTAGVVEDVYDPTFSPDGTQLVVRTFDAGTGTESVATMPADGSAPPDPIHSTSSYLAGVSWQPLCTIRGTRKDDVIKGTQGDDFICGLGGNDTINGAGGNDRLLGGGGLDKLTGGAGNDILVGGEGRDWLLGGYNADFLLAVDSGHDNLSGGSGTDSCWRNSGDQASACE